MNASANLAQEVGSIYVAKANWVIFLVSYDRTTLVRPQYCVWLWTQQLKKNVKANMKVENDARVIDLS